MKILVIVTGGLDVRSLSSMLVLEQIRTVTRGLEVEIMHESKIDWPSLLKEETIRMDELVLKLQEKTFKYNPVYPKRHQVHKHQLHPQAKRPRSKR